jgi:Putative Ig domain
MKRHASLLLLGSATILTGMVGVAELPASAQPQQPTTLSTSLADGSISGPTLTVPPSASVSDTATFDAGTGATAKGSVQYIVFSDSACNNAVDTLASQHISTPGTLPSSAAVSLAPGTYYWQVSYSGDPNNAPSSSPCGAEIETVLSSGAQTTTTTKPTPYKLLQGASSTDTATVSGNATNGPPTGTVNFTLCGPLENAVPPTPCTAPTDMTSIPVPLAPASNHTSTATSAPMTALSPGWWCFDNTYSGDPNYYSSSDNNSKECIDVVPLPNSSPDYAGFAVIENAGSPSQQGVSPDQPSATSSAQTTFTVPTENCTSTPTGIIIGSGIFSSISNWVSAAGVVVACTGGVASYSTEEVVNNTQYTLSITPVPGDTVTTSVNIVPGSTTVTLDDVTQGVRQSESGAGMTGTYMSDGIDGDGDPSPLAPGDFGAMTYSNSSIDGESLAAAGAVPVSWVNSDGVLQILTSQLNGNGGFGLTPEIPGRITPTMATAPASSSIQQGAGNTDTATVTGDSASGSSTGTVSFYECGPTPSPRACTSQANPVGGPQGLTAGAGNIATATSPSFTPTASGYWCFAGYYSGDLNYNVSSDTSTTECFDVTSVPLQIITSSLPPATIGSPYSTTLQATGGTRPYKFWKVISGSLPAGLTLHGKTGVISGRPSASAVSSEITVRVRDSSHPKESATATFTLDVES